MATCTVKALHISSPKCDRVIGELVPGVALKRLPKKLKAEGKVDETPLAKEDETRMMKFYEERNIQAESVVYNKSKHGGKQPILEKIKAFFEEHGTHFILSYSGHGCEHTNECKDEAGAWAFQIQADKSEKITFQDIIHAWDDARSGQGPCGLMIISDSCYSGELVEQVNKLSRKNICVQASCRAKQTCTWGTFTKRFVKATHTGNTGKALVHMLTFDIPYMIMNMWQGFTPISSRYSPSGFGEIVFFDS